MKKMFFILLAALFLTVFACAEDVVLPTFAWEHDGLNHWQLDASGAAVNLGPHDTGDGWLCTVCGCEVLDWGDGCYDVTDYDAYGNVVRYSSYDAEGNLMDEIINVLTLNEDGLPLKALEYFNGVLCGEYIYTVSEDGDWLPVSYTAWNDDGTTSVNQYDEHGNCVYAAVYEADGALIHETISEFAPIEDEWFGTWYYECKTTSRFASGETFYDEHNEYGDPVCSRSTDAEGIVWADTAYEYEYQDDMKVWCKRYSFGVLEIESFYNENGSCVKETEYLEDGSTIVSLYEDNGDAISITTYDADGAVVTVTTYEYVYDDEYGQLGIRMYIDDVLAEEIFFLYDEELGFIGHQEITYHEDGTRTVEEYDDWFELVRTIVYDADGSVIREEAATEAAAG